jgi:homoserine kinase
MTQRFRVIAPASLSNLGPGFDVLGLALHEPADCVEAERTDAPGVEIVDVGGEGGALPRDPALNVAGVSARHVWERASRRGRVDVRDVPGIRLWLSKGIPIASGLGGSAASSVAGALAANAVLGSPFSRLELFESALAGEAVAAVTAHGDNIAPCLLGGFALVRSLAPLDVVSLPVPVNLFLAVVHPHCEVPTAAARALLQDRRYNLADAVASGALACSISGSGPTMFAVAAGRGEAERAAGAMRDAFTQAASLDSDVFVGQVNPHGATVSECTS